LAEISYVTSLKKFTEINPIKQSNRKKKKKVSI